MPGRGRWRLLPLSAVVGLLAQPVAAQSPSASAPGRSSASAAASSTAAPPAPAAVVSDPRGAQIRALLRADLDVSIDPRSLFDVALDDGAAIDVERVRLRALLHAIDAAELPVEPVEPPAGSPVKRPGSPRASSSAPPAAAPSPATSTRAEIAGLTADRWDERLDLDRARLAFYELPAAERAELLDAHQARQEASRPSETAEERRAREADADRKRALEAAAAARSEAERLVAEEMARVIGVGSAIERVRAELMEERARLAARRDEILGWQRRVRDAKAGGPLAADATYKALRAALRASRDALSAALDEMHDASSDVPLLGADPTSELGGDARTTELRDRRQEVEKLAVAVRAEESELRAQRPAALQEEISTLNRERLGLLPALSPALRSATTGLTEAGMDQARSESRHLILVLRYHREIALEWLRTLRDSRGKEGISAWGVAAVLVPWTLLVAAFVWFRRRSPALLAAAHQRSTTQDRAARRTVPSVSTRALVVARGVHRPLEWLAFFGLTVSLLPTKARGLLEVEILVVVIGWTLGAALVVNGIHAVAAAADVAGTASKEVAQLRLRSLQLVGRVFVIFALILVVSARLVGEGTLYSWTITTCWLAALPVFLVLVRWWREVVFQRVEAVRRKSGFQEWILANRRGWTSFLAAMAGAVHLFTLGAFKVLRKWVTGFDIARRAHAYLFKRGLDRMAETDSATPAKPLDAASLALLAPDLAADTWIACPADDVIAHLRARLHKDAHGVVAVIGAIGMGKTALLRQLDAGFADARHLTCTAATTPDDLAALLPSPASVASVRPRLMLLDEAHAFIRPVSGGLRAFDAALAFARDHSDEALWVFAIDAVVWPYLQRARDARPLFDEVLFLARWSDESIGELLTSRCAAVGMAPTFEDLLDKLPPGADEIDRQDALAEKRTGYFRMVWDYARGNPALALEAWRSSLVESEAPAGVEEPAHATAPTEEGSSDGDAPQPPRIVRVRPLQTPPATMLEALPDPALFILRAVLQLSRATVAEVATATRMSELQVQNAVSFGVSQGYYAVEGGVVHVTWPWLRSVILWLERRHLLVSK